MQNRSKLKNLINIKDFAIIGLLIWVGWQSCGRKEGDTIINKKNLINQEIRDSVGPPVINNHHYTNIQPERVVEHHYHNEPIDTSAVVQDYFRARYYRDSVINDTISYWWMAKVARNTLDSLSFRTSFKPRTRIITNSYEVNRPAIGLTALYVNSVPYIGVFGTMETRRFVFMGSISPMNRGAFQIGLGLKLRK